MDFVRFLHPRFAGARALRERIKRKVLPVAYHWLDAIPRLTAGGVRRAERARCRGVGEEAFFAHPVAGDEDAGSRADGDVGPTAEATHLRGDERVVHGHRREEALVREDVGPAVKHEAVAGQAVPPGAANLLVPRLDIARHVAVDDETHIRLVDAHAERDGGNDDIDVITSERFLRVGALLVEQAGVIRTRANSLREQEVRRLCHALS